MAPSAYLSRMSLARELDVSESTIDEMVKRGVIPPGVRFSAGCVRWCWADVEVAIQARKVVVAGEVSDPYSRGARNATQTPERRGDLS